MSRRPDERDRQPPKHDRLTPAPGVVIEQWHEQPSAVHSEPWLFRALKDLKADIGTVATRQTKQGEDIAEIRGKVDTLTQFVPRPKSPSDGVAKALLANQAKSSASWRKWAQRILFLVVTAGVGWVGKLLVG